MLLGWGQVRPPATRVLGQVIVPGVRMGVTVPAQSAQVGRGFRIVSCPGLSPQSILTPMDGLL